MDHWATIGSSSDNVSSFILVFCSIGVWKELKGFAGDSFKFRSKQFSINE